MKLKITIFSILLSSIIHCQEIKIKTITIHPYLSFQNYEHFKRLTLNSPDSEAEYIENFEFHWGYTYKLKVKETKLKSRLSDGTQYTYTLEKIISKTKEKDNSNFKLFLNASRYYDEVDTTEQNINKTFSQINDSTFLYFNEVEIEVPTSLIKEFKTIIENKLSKTGTFTYISEKKVRLIKL